MRNLKSIIILSTLVILLLATHVVLWHGTGEVKASGRQTLVEGVEGLRLIRLERQGAPTVELGRTGPLWRLRAPYPGSVDDQVVMRFLDVLAMAKISDVLSDSALLKLGRTRADFSLAEPALKVVLSDENGVRESIGFGATTPVPGGVFVSIGDLDSVFVVSSNVLSTVNVDAERFRRRSLFTIGPDAVTSFMIRRRADAPFEFVREDSDWKVGNASMSSRKVREFLSGLTSAEALSFVWPVGASNETEHASTSLLVRYGLDPDTAVTVTLKGADGEDRRISFGKSDDHGHAYALVHGGTAIVTVPEVLKESAEQGESVFADSRLFPLEPQSVNSFSVAEKDVQYALARDKVGLWAIESPIVAKADDAVVDELLARVLALSASDVVPPGEGVAVSIATNADKSVVSRASVFGRRTPEELRSREILRIDPVRIKRIARIEGGGGRTDSVVYDRERKSWNVEEGAAGGVADIRGVNAVLSAINPLSAVRIEKLKVPAADLDDYGLDTPFLTVAIDQDVDGAARRNILIGKKTGGGRFATVGSSDAVFVVGDDLADRLASAIIGK